MPIVVLPVPPPVFSCAQGESLDAVHAQFAPFVVMPISPVPPAGPNGEPRRDVSSVTEHARRILRDLERLPTDRQRADPLNRRRVRR